MLLFLKKNMIKSLSLWLAVLKMMVPIAIIVKILDEMGMVVQLGEFLSPFMIFLGLPGILGWVWAVTLMTNLWAGIMLCATLVAQGLEVTTAQMTILGMLMLMAHSLPIEVRVAQKCGVQPLFSFVLRVASALILGVFCHEVLAFYDLLQEPARLIIADVSVSETSYWGWIQNQISSYLFILLTLTVLTLFVEILKKYHLMHKAGVWLSPYFKLMGLKPSCAPLTLVGMTLGLVYGGTLLAREKEEGTVTEDDLMLSVTSLNLFHSIIEDTLIIMMMGSALVWILGVRLLYTILVMRGITTLLKYRESWMHAFMKA